MEYKPSQPRQRSFVTAALLAVIAVVIATPASGHNIESGDNLVDDGGFVYEGEEVNPDIPTDGNRDLSVTDPEVAFIAEKHGVSAEDALAIVTWMVEAEDALLDVRRIYPDTYAGAEFVHNSGNVSLDMYVTGDRQDETATTNAVLSDPPFASVNVKEAPLSEKDLVALTESMPGFAPVPDPNEGNVGSLDFKTGTFKLHEGITVRSTSHNDCTHGTGGWLEGGRLLRIATSGSHWDKSDGCLPAHRVCTSGFTARLDGYQGILTAGHCLEGFSSGFRNGSEMYANGTELFVSLRTHKWDSIWDDDAGFMREVYASADPRGRIYLDQNNGWRDIGGLLPYAAPDGATRCHKSAGPNDLGTPPDHSKGFKCGTVQDGNYCVYWNGWWWCRYTAVDNPNWPSGYPKSGSSGGPWFISNRATGTQSGVDDNGWAIYYRLDWARNALPGLDIYCGGTSEYLCSWP